MTDQDAGDGSQVEPLLDQIDMPIGQFTADGAYDGNPTYDDLTTHSADAAVVIPPRTNSVERPDSDPLHQRDRHVAAINAGDVAGRDRLRQTLSGRDRDRSLEIDHRTAAASVLVRGTADGSRPRLRRPQSDAGLRAPESVRSKKVTA